MDRSAIDMSVSCAFGFLWSSFEILVEFGSRGFGHDVCQTGSMVESILLEFNATVLGLARLGDGAIECNVAWTNKKRQIVCRCV